MQSAVSRTSNLMATGAARTNKVDGERPVRLMIVEDEVDLLEMLAYKLRKQDFDVTTAANGEEAIERLQEQLPDIILLDLMLPGIDGLEVCRLVKSDPAFSSVSIIMLTARGEDRDMVKGFEIGADDYVTKPYNLRLLIARIRAVARRAATGTTTEFESEGDPIIRVDDLMIHPNRHEVRLSGELIDLTPTEFRLLKLLASRPGRVFARPQIIHAIHGTHVAVTDRSVDVQVLHLRRKLGSASERIEAVRGVGYRFRDQAHQQ
jgi:two-component system phosphate regulon response regulator PhoB